MVGSATSVLAGGRGGASGNAVRRCQPAGAGLRSVGGWISALDLANEQDGFILLTRTQPIRYAVERAEQNGTTLGEEYFSQVDYTYRTGWNEDIALTKRTYTMSDLLNVFSTAGLWIETTIEPHLPEEATRRYPHKQAWMNKYLGILIFKLRPLGLF